MTDVLMAMMTAFGGGVLASLTPCVYPMIPITISFMAGRSTSRFQALSLSLIYVLGMMLTYTALGIFAALTGKVFGKITMSGPIYFIVGAIIIFFGLVQLGVFSFKIPQFSFGGSSQRGYGGACVMGLTSGLVVAPCTAPILGSILAYIASHQSILFGIVLMFSFSLGLGLLFIVLGTFTGFLTSLPKSGAWMMTIEKISGVLLLIIGVYFLLKVFI